MLKSLKLSIVVVMTVLSWRTHAQSGSGSITGFTRSTDKKAVANTSVRVKGTALGTASDSTGRFAIVNVVPGRYTLLFTHVNYRSDSLIISVRAGESVKVDPVLTEHISALDEIQVTGKTESQIMREKPFSVNVIDMVLLQQKNLDLTKVLNQSSGVRLRQNAGLGSSYDLTLNGFKASQFINGIPVDVYGPAYDFNSMAVNQIERIEIYKGVVPIHLGGDALGGAVNIVTKTKLDNHLGLAYSIGSFNTHKASAFGAYSHAASGFTVTGSAFFNSSDNRYVMKDMEILENTIPVKKDVRRFHDRFLSYAGKVEMGITNKNIADVLLIGAGASGIRRDIQTGSTQYPAIGDATGEEDNTQLSLRYSKHAIKDKLDLDAFILLNTGRTVFVDTSSMSYRWDGTIEIVRPPKSKDGEFDDKQIYRTEQRDLTQRYNMSWHINAAQMISVNVIATSNTRGSTDPGKTDGASVDDNESSYSKLIAGIGHELKLVDDRLQTIAFIKYYRMKASTDSATKWLGGYFERVPAESSKSFYGGGLGVSYAFTKHFLARMSAEYACRFPTVYELLGDGIGTMANVGLKPEESINYNAGILTKLIDRDHLTLIMNTAGFFRKAENFIRASTGVRRTIFINFDKALVRGIETEIKATLRQKLTARLAATYQRVLDDAKYVGGTQDNYSYRIQLPNTPSLFGNADVEYKFRGLFHQKITLTPYYNVLYVKEFYLGYENVARGDLKYTIPTQLVQDLGVTASDATDRYSLSFECTNFTNAGAFDNFRLQKAGRSFNFKVTCNIK